MIGLFGTLDLAQRALQTQRQGVEVTGHNLANANRAGYTRQRLTVQAGSSLSTLVGQFGTGVEAVTVQQIRDGLVDRQMQDEISVRSSLETQQTALQWAQANLGQQIDSTSNSTAGASTSGNAGLADRLTNLFNSFQSLATQPTSLEARQGVLLQAQDLAGRFNQIDQQLSKLSGSLSESMKSDVTSANQLLTDISRLNDEIKQTELGSKVVANDLRDARQEKLEELSKLIKVDASESGGVLTVSLNGTSLVAGKQVVDTLEAYDAGGGQWKIRTQTGAQPLDPTGGSMHGYLTARDGVVAQLRADVNTLASQLITQVNTLHSAGYGLAGSTGAAFFTGTNAADIQVSSQLVNQPALLQVSASAGASGDNTVALNLARLADQPQAALSNQTLSQFLGQSVAALGGSLSSINGQLTDQKMVESWLQQQRDAVSGVSLDEEMTNLTKYQKAFEASARLVTTVDEMLDTVLNMKR